VLANAIELESQTTGVVVSSLGNHRHGPSCLEGRRPLGYCMFVAMISVDISTGY
jgi:hypothetical protein